MLNRRRFLSLSAALPLGPSVLRHGRGDKLRLAAFGVGGRGRANLSSVLGERVVAVCDVDSRHLKAGADLVASGGEAPKQYRDYRELLEREELDGVVVSTPDHTHACIAADAMERGLHAYVEKPLAQTVNEVRQLQRLAKARGLVTQMGTQIHAGENYRRVVEHVRGGAIGAVREAHVWVGKSWSNGRLRWPQEVPDYLDWELWQGPAERRPYQRDVHPAGWRRYWDYGTGTLGDMGCHYLDVVHWALELGVPKATLSEGPAVHPVGTPHQMKVTWTHDRKTGSGSDLKVHWYDGGLKPEGARWGSGVMFVGEAGVLHADYGRLEVANSANPKTPKPWIPKSVGHHNEWIHAIKTGSDTTCEFGYSGDLSAAVLLGNVAFRVGRQIEWNPGTGTIAGDAEATALLGR